VIGTTAGPDWLRTASTAPGEPRPAASTTASTQIPAGPRGTITVDPDPIRAAATWWRRVRTL